MNTPVNFEIAKLLKEKEFDVKTTDSYVDTTPFSENENDFVEYFFKQNHNEKEHRVSAPTIAEVVMWLYEKHGIWIYIKQGYKWEWYIETVANHPELKYYDGLEDSPTEAYESAIKHTLENLIKEEV